jgi:hypothetical protein
MSAAWSWSIQLLAPEEAYPTGLVVCLVFGTMCGGCKSRGCLWVLHRLYLGMLGGGLALRIDVSLSQDLFLQHFT